MQLRALALLLLPLLGHELYHAFKGWDANWCQWVAEHGASVVLCLLLGEFIMREFHGWPRVVALGSLAWLGFECLQAQICGSLLWGEMLPGDNRICRDEFGNDPYVILFAGALSFVVTKGILKWKKVA